MLRLWEKHSSEIIRGLVIAAIVGLVSWYGSYHGTIGSIKTTVSTICEDIRDLTKEIKSLSHDFVDYRVDSAKAQVEIQEDIHKIKVLAEQANDKVSRIEKRVNKLHQDFYDHKISKGHNQ